MPSICAHSSLLLEFGHSVLARCPRLSLNSISRGNLKGWSLPLIASCFGSRMLYLIWECLAGSQLIWQESVGWQRRLCLKGKNCGCWCFRCSDNRLIEFSSEFRMHIAVTVSSCLWTPFLPDPRTEWMLSKVSVRVFISCHLTQINVPNVIDLWGIL